MKKTIHNRIIDGLVGLLFTGIVTTSALNSSIYQEIKKINNRPNNQTISLDYDQIKSDSLISRNDGYLINNSESPANLYIQENGIKYSKEEIIEQKRVRIQLRTIRSLERFYGKEIIKCLPSGKGTNTYSFKDGEKIVIRDQSEGKP